MVRGVVDDIEWNQYRNRDIETGTMKPVPAVLVTFVSGAPALMIENQFSGLLWRLMRASPHVVRGAASRRVRWRLAKEYF